MAVPDFTKGLSAAPLIVPMPDDVVPAAVLVVITQDDAPHLILTRRSATLHKHAGQISFPGGRVDPEDDSVIATALREAQEEIALSPHGLEILGFLPDMLTGTGYRITPVVAQSPQTAAQLMAVLVPNPAEVDEILMVPLSVVLTPANYDSFLRQDKDVSWRSWRVLYEGQTIWGATAAILHKWANALSWSANQRANHEAEK